MTVESAVGAKAPGHPEKGKHEGEHRLKLRVQTPRGLWSMKEPADATLRPSYEPTVLVQQVIDDARAVFGFVENDSKYALFRGRDELDPARTLGSYDLRQEELLVLSVQGGNAA